MGQPTMKHAKSVGGMLVALLLLSPAGWAYAQYPSLDTRRFSRPPLSPWLQLFRRDVGPLPNYHQFVRPEQRLRQTLTQQETALRWQGAQIRSLQGQATAGQRTGMPQPTGTGSVFLDYSHYYPGFRSAGRR